MCNKAAGYFFTNIKFVPDWFVTSKVIKKLDDPLFSNTNIIFINEGSSNVTFLVVKWVLLV